MLKKSQKITTKYELGKTRKYGKKHNSKLFRAYFLRLKDGGEPTRANVVVPNSFHKLAVKRNRVKRLIRETLRLNFAKIPAGYWVVIYPNPEILEENYEAVSSEFNKILQKIPISG